MIAGDLNVLANRRCKPCEGGVAPLHAQQVAEMLKGIPGWGYSDDGYIEKAFDFADFRETMAFVNAVAWVADRENHHPDLQVTYKTCTVRYRTHAIEGLSENDFICAAKVESLLRD